MRVGREYILFSDYYFIESKPLNIIIDIFINSPRLLY